MKIYLTLFNEAYLAKGLAMYRSLEKHHKSEDFLLIIKPLDDYTEDKLRLLGLEHVNIWSWNDFDKILFSKLESKHGRPNVFWSLASQYLATAFSLFNLKQITYLDADLFFYSDPKPIWDEIDDKQVAICPHNFPSWDAERLRGSGQYNVAWVTFAREAVGHLNDWAGKVAQRCDASTCGDQKYLDEWEAKLGDKLCIIQHRGCDIAPWNIGRMEVFRDQATGELLVDDLEERFPYDKLIFYHFHEWKSPESRTGYKLRPTDIELIYEPYEKAIEQALEEIGNAVESL